MAKQKAPALEYVCQSKNDTMAAIRTLGDTQRELVRIETELNDQIAAITDSKKEVIEALKSRVKQLTSGIQTWCESNRAELCKGGTKTANLTTGVVSWRQRPPSVQIRAADKVLEALKAFGLERFIRVKPEPNKEAILAEPQAIAGIAGITIITGHEDFAVEPFEVEVTQ
ncbi:MAG: host-nuclease inhibitor protein Gam [Methylomonas sp.]|nr:MAG: host-nuclease inhibitor protein Gam [Methylomonas sp.]